MTVLHGDARQEKVGSGFKLLYGAGAIADGMANTALNLFLLFYLTSVCGLSGTLAGTALLLGLVIDAIADPAIGLISDRTRSRFGRRLPFLALSAIPLALSFGMLFSVPAGLSQTGLLIYVVVSGLALRLAMSFFLLPYTSVGAEVTDNYADRSSIVSYRVCFSMLGGFLTIALGLGVFMAGPDGLLHRSAYMAFGWTGAVVIAVTCFAATVATRNALPRLHKPAPDNGQASGGFFREILGIFRSRSFVILFSAIVAFCVGQGMAAAAAIHLNTYFWKLPTSSTQLILLGLATAPFAGAPLTALLARRFDKRSLVIAWLLVFVFSQMWPPLAAIAGLMPAEQTALVGVLFVNAVLTGIGLIGASICAQSMMADAADEYEYLHGVRREGLFYAGLSLGLKASAGVGGFLAGVALDLIHFPTGHMAGAAALSRETWIGLGIVAGPLPALITLLGPIAFIFYGLSRERYREIVSELERRRA